MPRPRATCATPSQKSGRPCPGAPGPAWSSTAPAWPCSVEGVSQTIATNIGDSYTLTFWVGNVDSPNTGFGVTSTVSVFANATALGMFTNSCTTCATQQAWQRFMTTFTATSTSSTVKFLNADPANDNDLDNVSLVDNGPTAVPEPSSIVLLSSGLLGLVTLLRRLRP
jgi:hypothetical protein